MMEILEISQDDNEDDTSGDDIVDNENVVNLDELVDELGHELYQKFQLWRRPDRDSSPFLTGAPFTFYMMDCDSWASNEVNPLMSAHPIHHVIRLYGVTESGNSVCCLVHGFSPYFYAMPSNQFTEDDVSNFKDCLNLAVLNEMKKYLHSAPLLEIFNEEKPPIFQVELFHNPDTLNIYGFHQTKTCKGTESSQVVLKISCFLTKFVWLAAKVLKKRTVSFPYVDNPCSYELFEDTFNPTLRFLTSLNISCCTWLQIQLTPGNWLDRDSQLDPALRRQSYAQLELDVGYTDITTEHSECQKKSNSSMPKLRILSFDIECMTRPPKYNMPMMGNDRVLQIGTIVLSPSDNISSTCSAVKCVFVLGTCDSIPDAHVFSFNNEASLLKAWRLFVIMTDPDILTGYNINKFDIPFIIERANVVGANKAMYFGRIKNTPTSYRPIENRRKRANTYADTIPTLPGRVIFDMYPVMKQNFPTESPFTLANMSKKFLDFEEKGDVKYTEIFKLQNMSPITRSQLAKYCLQDAWLAVQLLLKNPRDTEDEGNFVSFYCEKSSSSGSPLRYLTTKSNDYNKYFKMVRKQKNPDYFFTPVTPAKRKREVMEKREKVRRALFRDDKDTVTD